MSNTPFNPFAPVSCQQAASNLRAILGLAAFGPHVSEMLRSLDKCNGAGCPGHPTISVVAAAAEKHSQDVVLALFN